ncbi:MAG: hypothetical protein ACYDB7_03405 [Mycobacteriales bacterium]
MDAAERTSFISNYSKLLVGAWSDTGVADRLVADPKAVLSEFGLTVSKDARVTVVRQIPASHGAPDVDVQVRLWEEGQRTGSFEMHVPETPQIDMSELSESELEGVAGGWSISCCSCCPCCCCA